MANYRVSSLLYANLGGYEGLLALDETCLLGAPSGVSSSVVGTMAGQVIMDGFVGWTIPLWVRRVVTMLPALLVIALGVSTTETLVLSQVVLSIVLPFAVVPLVWFTAKSSIMGILVNHRRTTAFATLCAAVIVGLNGVLLYSSLGGAI